MHRVLPHLCGEGGVVASEDHGLAAAQALGDEGVGAVAGGGVESDVGFVEKHERTILDEDLGELSQAQVRGRQVKRVGFRVEAEGRDGVRVADELPHRGFGELVGGALQRERDAKRKPGVAVEAGHRAQQRGLAGAVVAAQPHGLAGAHGQVDRAGGELRILVCAELPPLAGFSAAGGGDLAEIDRIAGGLHAWGQAGFVGGRG